jgi:hypothetical protein
VLIIRQSYSAITGRTLPSTASMMMRVLAGAIHDVGVGILFAGYYRGGIVDHLAGCMAMQIEFGANWKVRPYNSAHMGQQVAFRVA